MKKFVCTVCGYIHEGESLEGVVCPVCNVGADKFEEMSGELKWADEHRIGVAQGIDEEVIEGLRANFVGECTEVGMYLQCQDKLIEKDIQKLLKLIKE